MQTQFTPTTPLAPPTGLTLKEEMDAVRHAAPAVHLVGVSLTFGAVFRLVLAVLLAQLLLVAIAAVFAWAFWVVVLR